MGRFNTGTMTVGIFAVLFGLVGAYALRAALTREEPPPKPGPKTVNVPLAGYDLPAGRKVARGDIVLYSMTQEEMVGRKLPLDKLILGTEDVIGRIVRAPMKQGDGFLTTNFYPEGTGPAVADKLKPGLRAVTIPIDDLSSVGAAAVEGSIVDVLFRATPKPADKENRHPEIPQTTVTLIEGSEVIAVGRNQARDRNRNTLDLRQTNQTPNSNVLKSVTLAVTLEQANMLKTVMGRGELSLALRAVGETSHNAIDQMTLENLLGLKSPPPPFTTEIYRGGARQTLTFEDQQVIKETFGGSPPQSNATPTPAPVSPPAPAPTGAQDRPSVIIMPGGNTLGPIGMPYGSPTMALPIPTPVQ
jgi:pilus assembly protein CpaB